jgi:hypothetical protein
MALSAIQTTSTPSIILNRSLKLYLQSRAMLMYVCMHVCQKNQPKQIVSVVSKTLAVSKFASTASHESIHSAKRLFLL